MSEGRDDGAQDIIDAVRWVLLAQDDPEECVKLVKVLLEFAPETKGDCGMKIVIEMIVEGSLKVALVGD